mgnify:FL=1
MPLLRLTKVRAQRAHRRNFLDHVRKQILSGWGLLFFKRKGSLCMNQEAFVDTRVLEFTSNHGFDPEVGQELFLKHEIDLTSDGDNKTALEDEIKTLANLKRKLERERDKLNEGGLLQFTYRLNGQDLRPAFEPLISQIEEMISFGKLKFQEETSGTRANMKAHRIADYVAALFVAHNRNVGFGVKPLNSSEPSTPFGRAVQDAIEVFKVYKLPQGSHGKLELAHWKKPAEHAAKAVRKSQ